MVQHATLTKASCEQTSGVLITVCKARSCCQVATLCLGEDMNQGSFKKKAQRVREWCEKFSGTCKTSETKYGVLCLGVRSGTIGEKRLFNMTY